MCAVRHSSCREQASRSPEAEPAWHVNSAQPVIRTHQLLGFESGRCTGPAGRQIACASPRNAYESCRTKGHTFVSVRRLRGRWIPRGGNGTASKPPSSSPIWYPGGRRRSPSHSLSTIQSQTRRWPQPRPPQQAILGHLTRDHLARLGALLAYGLSLLEHTSGVLRAWAPLWPAMDQLAPFKSSFILTQRQGRCPDGAQLCSVRLGLTAAACRVSRPLARTLCSCWSAPKVQTMHEASELPQTEGWSRVLWHPETCSMTHKLQRVA